MPGPGFYDHTRVVYRPKPGAPFTTEERASLDRLAKALKPPEKGIFEWILGFFGGTYPDKNTNGVNQYVEDEETRVVDRLGRSEFLRDGSFQLSKLINMKDKIGPSAARVATFAHNLLLEPTSATVVDISIPAPSTGQILSTREGSRRGKSFALAL